MYKILFFISITLSFSVAQTLNIAMQSTKNTYNLAMQDIKLSFEKEYPNIKINLHFYDGSSYKKNFDKLLQNPKYDILTWQAGQRLFDYKEKLHVLNDAWYKFQFNTKFYSNLQHNIITDNKIYALPVSYYTWGIYYNKRIFQKYNLTPPSTMNDLLDVSKELKKNNITPIILGGKNHWTSVAWFDYINLRLNGLQFHQQLLQGKISYHDPKVYKVFEYLQHLVNNQSFIEQFEHYSWLEPMPYLYRQKGAMTLIGNFFATHIPKMVQNDIGYIQFPHAYKNAPIYYENAPLEVFVISKKSKNKQLAEKFFNYFTKKAVINTFNKKQNLISPLKSSINTSSAHLQEVKKILDKASGLAQFYDIDSKQEFAKKALREFTLFIKEPNIERTATNLENLRLEYYGTIKR